MRSAATTPASSTPPMAASNRATPRGIVPLAVKYEILTDLVFCRMNTSSSASTTAAAMTPTQAAERRVRPVWRGERAPLALGSVGINSGRGSTPDDDGASLTFPNPISSGASQAVLSLSQLAVPPRTDDPDFLRPGHLGRGTNRGRPTVSRLGVSRGGVGLPVDPDRTYGQLTVTTR